MCLTDLKTYHIVENFAINRWIVFFKIAPVKYILVGQKYIFFYITGAREILASVNMNKGSFEDHELFSLGDFS